MEKPRLLKAEEIEVRVQSVKESKNGVGAILLLYKDARVDMNILDEWVGPTNWQREHSRDNANCIISIWDKEKDQWVKKEDTGTESNTEKEKGLASDSFKRAGFNWGIGRELYTAPFVWVELSEKEHFKGSDGKAKASPFLKFKVSMIQYDDARNIVGLIITDAYNKERYKLGNPMPQEKGTDLKAEAKRRKEERDAKKKAEEAAKNPEGVPDLSNEIKALWELTGKNKDIWAKAMKNHGFRSKDEIKEEDLFKLEATITELLDETATD